MTNSTGDPRSARRARHEAIRAEVAQEEAEAAERAGALEVPLHLRITKDLDAQLRQEAEEEQIPTSALVRRLLTQGLHRRERAGLTQPEVEEVARRVVREELQEH